MCDIRVIYITTKPGRTPIKLNAGRFLLYCKNEINGQGISIIIYTDTILADQVQLSMFGIDINSTRFLIVM